MLFVSPSRGAVPHHNARIERIGVDQTKTSEIIPSDAARTAEIARNLSSDFLGNAYGFSTDLLSRRFFIRRFCMSPCSSDYIITSKRCRALVGRLFFRHCLVVTPSAALGLSPYVCGLARDCLKESSPEFTRFFKEAPASKRLTEETERPP